MAIVIRSSRLLPSAALAAAVLVVVELLLRTVSTERVMAVLRVEAVLTGGVGPPRSAPLPGWASRRVRGALAVLRRSRSSGTCLRRSLVLAVLLRRLGPVVRFGWVPRPGGGFAHAWVEVAGESLESGLEGVLPFQSGDGRLPRVA